MCKISTKTVADATSCSAMETGDHTKNGASPKSQMSREMEKINL
jgi:hypothetical protein